MVRDVEKFSAEFEVAALSNLEALGDRQIPVDDARSDDRVAAGTAITELRRDARQAIDERGQIEEVARILLIAGEVGIDAGGVGITGGVGVLNAAEAAGGGG